MLRTLVCGEDVAEFERDMHSMDELSKKAPGLHVERRTEIDDCA